MATVTLPVTARTTANANNFSDVKDNDQAIIDQVNGNLDANNLASNAVTTAKITDSAVTSAKIADGTIAAGDIASDAVTTAKVLNANVTDAKLASPNNSAYKTILTQPFYIQTSIAATWYADATGTVHQTGVATSTAGPTMYESLTADYLVGGLSTKYRIKLAVMVGSTSPSTTVLTAGLHALSVSSGNITMAAATSGSTAASSGLATNTISRFNSTDFAIPADGVYCLGIVVSTTTVPAGIQAAVQLQTRNV